jgi:hypothetical protein
MRLHQAAPILRSSSSSRGFFMALPTRPVEAVKIGSVLCVAGRC